MCVMHMTTTVIIESIHRVLPVSTKPLQTSEQARLLTVHIAEVKAQEGQRSSGRHRLAHQEVSLTLSDMCLTCLPTPTISHVSSAVCCLHDVERRH